MSRTRVGQQIRVNLGSGDTLFTVMLVQSSFFFFVSRNCYTFLNGRFLTLNHSWRIFNMDFRTALDGEPRPPPRLDRKREAQDSHSLRSVLAICQHWSQWGSKQIVLIILAGYVQSVPNWQIVWIDRSSARFFHSCRNSSLVYSACRQRRFLFCSITSFWKLPHFLPKNYYILPKVC